MHLSLAPVSVVQVCLFSSSLILWNELNVELVVVYHCGSSIMNQVITISEIQLHQVRFK